MATPLIAVQIVVAVLGVAAIRFLVASAGRSGNAFALDRLRMIDLPVAIVLAVGGASLGVAPPDAALLADDRAGQLAAFAWTTIGLPILMIGATLALGVLTSHRLRCERQGVVAVAAATAILMLATAAGRLELVDAQLLVLGGLIALWVVGDRISPRTESGASKKSGTLFGGAIIVLFGAGLGAASWATLRSGSELWLVVPALLLFGVAGPIIASRSKTAEGRRELHLDAVCVSLAGCATLGLGLASFGVIIARSAQRIQTTRAQSGEALAEAVIGVARAFPPVDGLGSIAPASFALVLPLGALLWIHRYGAGARPKVVSVCLLLTGLVTVLIASRYWIADRW